MKKILVLLLLILSVGAMAQPTAYDFDAATIPDSWSTPNGALTLSTEHYKDGAQSLCWESEGSGVLEVSMTAFNTGNNISYFQLYSPQITDDLLKMELIDAAGVVQLTARIKINFKGWRECARGYREYTQKKDFSLSKVRFTLIPETQGKRKLYFDLVEFKHASIGKKMGAHWVLDIDQLNAKESGLLRLFANPIDIPVVAPTEIELADLAKVKALLPAPKSAGTNLILARNKVKSYAIVRNNDGTVRGNVIDATSQGLNAQIVTMMLNTAETLAKRIHTSPSDSVLFVNFVDHFLDQGLAEGTNYEVFSNTYEEARYICAGLLNIAAVCSGERRTEVMKLVRWLSEYGAVYFPEDKYLSEFVTDVIYLYLPHFYNYAVYQEDPAIAVRELKALKRHMDRHTHVVPGTNDMIKIDGVGFHHWTHYNNYMYAYSVWVDYLHCVKGTVFALSPESYPRLRQAVWSIYLMANKASLGEKQFTANALSGRNPYTRGGINVPYGALTVEKLIEIGGDVQGKEIDPELAACYNYIFDTQKYDVPAKNCDGYYQFNYSPIGLARKDNWVVTMRAPTVYFWGAEIYPNQNVFGRYQSYGTMEVVYTGAYERSGMSINEGAGGWDWNVVPGTTTVHHTSWQDMMPSQKPNGRYDQNTRTKNFAGALAFGNCGVFASDFDQWDWNGNVFNATKLLFKKSVFTFDDLFVSLGSDISAVSEAYGNDRITATNLFQEVKSSYFKDFMLNGSVVAEGTKQTISAQKSNWVLTPLGTGYYIPKGNDDMTLFFDKQKTPQQSGKDYTDPYYEVTAAKMYINHGVKPTNSHYHFAMMPSATPEKMAALAAKAGDDGGELYKVESCTSTLHAVTHKGLNITGYAFFAANSNIPFGEVIATTAEHLLEVKRDTPNNRLHFAACNPNLRPKKDPRFEFLSTPTTTTLTLRGKWKVLQGTSGVGSAAIVGENTRLTVVMSEGMPEYFTLGDPNDTAVDAPLSTEWVTCINDPSSDQLQLLFGRDAQASRTVTIYAIGGNQIKQELVTGDLYTLTKASFAPGFYFMQVQEGANRCEFKFSVFK